MQLPRLVRRTYGTPVYEIAPGIESKSPILPSQLDQMPPIPEAPGCYLLVTSHFERGQHVPCEPRWVRTDGLTYRESANCIQVL